MQIQNSPIDITPIIEFCQNHRIRMKIVMDFPKYDTPELECSKDVFSTLMSFDNLEKKESSLTVIFSAKDKDSCFIAFFKPKNGIEIEELLSGVNLVYNGILVEKILDALEDIL